MRSRIVLRLTVNSPNLFFPLMWLKPGKSNVSGLPSPLRFRFCSEKMGKQYATCFRRELEVDRYRGVDFRRAASGAKGFVAPERYGINGGLT